MFGLGIWEIVLLLMVALIVLGPEKLPGLARQVGRGLRELRRASTELRSTLDDAYSDQPEAPKPTRHDASNQDSKTDLRRATREIENDGDTPKG